MLQKEWKKRLGGPGRIYIYKFEYYTIAVSYKYGSAGIEYTSNDTPNNIKEEASIKACKFIDDFINSKQTNNI